MNNQVLVCNQVCVPALDQSTTSKAKCYLPALPTKYSNDKYNISKVDYITGTPFSSNATLTMSLFDDIHQNGWTDTKANCFIGTAFKPNYLGVLTELGYFMNRFVKTDFVGNLVFQGSNDNITYTEIFTVGEEIHEGWNYYTFQAGEQNAFRYFRFFGSATKSCMLGEISFRGVEVINSTLATQVCTTQLNLNGNTVNLTGNVNFKSTITPLLKSVSPRFGTVVGGETITFSGEGFSTDIT